MSIWVIPNGAERVGLGRHRILLGLEVAHIGSARHAVIHERAGEALPRFRIVDEILGEALTDALADAAMDLARER
jgi:hypothetical protein